MIVRFSEAIRVSLFGKGEARPSVGDEATVVVMTPTGPQRVKMKKVDAGGDAMAAGKPSEAVAKAPEWLKDELAKGDVIIMDMEEWVQLPPEVQGEATILKH